MAAVQPSQCLQVSFGDAVVFLPALFLAATLPLLTILRLQDQSFQQSAASTYQSLRKGPWSDSSITDILDILETQLHQPGLRTFNRCAHACSQKLLEGAIHANQPHCCCQRTAPAARCAMTQVKSASTVTC